MKKNYFTDEYLRFFMELAANNHKEWFDRNKPRYIEFVKTPFEDFISDLIALLKKDEGLGDLKPADCIFRINRDVRFGKDKTPYKLHMSALIGKGGRKNMTDSALYIEIGPEFMNIYTGVHMPEKEQLLAIRKKIAGNMKKFNDIINEKNFMHVFGEIQGDKAKLLPADLKAKALEQSLIFNKQFYVMHQKPANFILELDLAKYIVKQYKTASAFNTFLSV